MTTPQQKHNTISMPYKQTILHNEGFTTKKTHISCQFCFEFFFVGNTYKFCYEKNICRKLLPIFFAKYFV